MKELATEEIMEHYKLWIRSGIGISDKIDIEYKKHPNPEDMKQKQQLKVDERRMIQSRLRSENHRNRMKAEANKGNSHNQKGNKGNSNNQKANKHRNKKNKGGKNKQ